MKNKIHGIFQSIRINPFFILLGSISFLVLLGGCATLVSDPVAEVKIDSSPPGAQVKYAGRVLGKTPLLAYIDRKAHKDNTSVTFSVFRKGYKAKRVSLHAVRNPLYYGNLALVYSTFGLPSSLIDSSTGYGYVYQSNAFVLELEKKLSEEEINDKKEELNRIVEERRRKKENLRKERREKEAEELRKWKEERQKRRAEVERRLQQQTQENQRKQAEIEHQKEVQRLLKEKEKEKKQVQQEAQKKMTEQEEKLKRAQQRHQEQQESLKTQNERLSKKRKAEIEKVKEEEKVKYQKELQDLKARFEEKQKSLETEKEKLLKEKDQNQDQLDLQKKLDSELQKERQDLQKETERLQNQADLLAEEKRRLKAEREAFEAQKKALLEEQEQLEKDRRRMRKKIEDEYEYVEEIIEEEVIEDPQPPAETSEQKQKRLLNKMKKRKQKKDQKRKQKKKRQQGKRDRNLPQFEIAPLSLSPSWGALGYTLMSWLDLKSELHQGKGHHLRSVFVRLWIALEEQSIDPMIVQVAPSLLGPQFDHVSKGSSLNWSPHLFSSMNRTSSTSKSDLVPSLSLSSSLSTCPIKSSHVFKSTQSSFSSLNQTSFSLNQTDLAHVYRSFLKRVQMRKQALLYVSDSLAFYRLLKNEVITLFHACTATATAVNHQK